MKKIISMLMLPVIIVSLTTTALAVYTNGPSNSFYNRTNAAQYVYDYTTTANSSYADFTGYGGDCTNFASQVLYAGGMPMTSKVTNPWTNDWYYYGGAQSPNYAPPWTNAHYFRTYWADVDDVGGKRANAFTKLPAVDFNNEAKWVQIYRYLEPGDIIQYVRTSDWTTYHSQAVHRTSFENGEFKVSVGQHTKNSWKNLRAFVQTLPPDYIVCAIKIKQPATSYSASSSPTSYLSNSTSELERLDEELFNSKPLSLEAENEKWAKINSIKEEFIRREKSATDDSKVPVTKNILIEFIDNRIENNNNVINSITYGVDVSTISTANGLLVQKCTNENTAIISFLTRVLESEEQNTESVSMLWNEFWNDILKQAPPSNYSCEN